MKILTMMQSHLQGRPRRSIAKDWGKGQVLQKWCVWISQILIQQFKYFLLIKFRLSFAYQVREVKPDVLLGLSAVGGLFSKEVYIHLFCALYVDLGLSSKFLVILLLAFHLRLLGKTFYALSCSDYNIFEHLFIFIWAGNGHIGHCNQGNNMYLFPGSVLGFSCWLYNSSISLIF